MSQAHPEFNVGQLVGDSWNVFKNNAGPLLGAIVVTWALVTASSVIPYIGPLILTGPLSLGLYKMTRAAIAGRPVEFGDLFSGFQKFLPAFLACLLTSIFTTIGAILCIIPGILVAIVYIPTYLFILDDNLDFWPAMEASRKLVMDNFVQWLILTLVLFGLNLAGTLACCVGLLVTTPMSLIVIVMAFDLERRGAVPESVAD